MEPDETPAQVVGTGCLLLLLLVVVPLLLVALGGALAPLDVLK